MEMNNPMRDHADAVPNGLRSWFVIHFVADMLFGIPLHPPFSELLW
jgi:hypothetical protein